MSTRPQSIEKQSISCLPIPQMLEKIQMVLAALGGEFLFCILRRARCSLRPWAFLFFVDIYVNIYIYIYAFLLDTVFQYFGVG